MDNTVSYTVISSLGEDHHADVPVTQALAEIVDTIKTQSKWVFVGRDQETVETLTEDKLLEAKKNKDVIVLNDILGGG